MSEAVSQINPSLRPVPVNDPPATNTARAGQKKKPAKKEAKAEKPKPTRTLPTDRINPSKQLEVLRAYAAASDLGTKSATVGAVAEMMKMASSTLALMHPFFASIGLLQRTDTGAYTPSLDVVNFLRSYDWNAETASHKLAGPMKDAWFGQALCARLRFKNIDEDEAISLLGESCGASRDYESQLRTIIDLMELCGVVQRDGHQIRAVKENDAPSATGTSTEPAASIENMTAKSAPKIATTFVQATGGSIQFGVNLQVDMQELATWRPDRITAFFAGVAQVLAAKASVERGGSQGS